MIISKPTIETFLEEAQDPIYHQVITKSKEHSMTVEFHATAFNNQNRVISYCYQFPWCFVIDEDSKMAFKLKAVEIEDIFISKAKNRKIVSGIINSTIIAGDYP